jgi:hypothetical protein
MLFLRYQADDGVEERKNNAKIFWLIAIASESDCSAPMRCFLWIWNLSDKFHSNCIYLYFWLELQLRTERNFRIACSLATQLNKCQF